MSNTVQPSLRTIPIIVLGGADRKPVTLPDTADDEQPLSGYKGLDLKVDGKPLIQNVIERLRATGLFEPVYVAGPKRIYEPLQLNAEIIDTDGRFGDNLRVVEETLRNKHRGQSLAFTVCDILPSVDTLISVAERYRQAAPCDLFYPLVRADRDLGPSAWKPTYPIIPNGETNPVPILPGHLVIADPSALRLRFIFRLINLAYRTRNRDIRHRRAVFLLRLVPRMLFVDLLNVVRLRPPSFTYEVVRAGLSTVMDLRAGQLTQPRIEDAGRTIIVRGRHRRRHPERRVHIPIVDALSLALDIDTQGEARAHGAHPSTPKTGHSS